MRNLKQLSVQSCVRLSNATAINIGASLPSLTSLNLRGCLQLTDEGVAALGPLTKLTNLSVQGCTALWGSCFKSLSGCSSLQVLNASGCSNLLYLQHVTGLVVSSPYAFAYELFVSHICVHMLLCFPMPGVAQGLPSNQAQPCAD